jgi:hypothetical protein
MANHDAVGNLGFNETEDLARFLVHHMTMEQRGRLMAERPVIYARLFPTVTPETISFKVDAAIHADRGTPVPNADEDFPGDKSDGSTVYPPVDYKPAR